MIKKKLFWHMVSFWPKEMASIYWEQLRVESEPLHTADKGLYFGFGVWRRAYNYLP
jgi:hypothetical protein